jgi:molybdopterin molybdotransferase
MWLLSKRISLKLVTRPAPAPLLPLDDALAQLLASVSPLVRTESIGVFDADGRVLAEDVISPLNVPAFDNSQMDGYAVRLSDLQHGTGPEAMPVLPVSARIAAGQAPQALQAMSIARIFTGAPIPTGSDAVVMQEDCQVVNDSNSDSTFQSQGGVRINVMPKIGQWIRCAGEDVQKGAVVLPRGTRLDPAALGLAASVGRANLQVTAKPRVALFSTGDELVMPGDVQPEDMKLGAIYNSNRFFLRALLVRMGCVVTDLGIVPDNRAATVEALSRAALQHDLILTSGGVSVGEEDHIKPAVQQLGELHLWQIAMKPGKPFAFGHINFGGVDKAYFVGLPGNPVSSFVTFLLLVRPLLHKLQGTTNVALRPAFPSILMRADFDLPKADKRREFLRVRRNNDGGLDLFPNQSSGVLTSVVWGDGLVDNPAGQTIAKGQMLSFIAFSDLLA